MATIHIYTGPMASGKTSKILHALHMYSNITKERVLLINYAGDDRVQDSVNGVSTHTYGDSSMKIPLGKYVDPIRVKRLSDVTDLDRYTHIGIDEANFYPDLENFILSNISNKELKFYISGLAYDKNNDPFGDISKLLPYATTFEKMAAFCAKCDPKNPVLAGFTNAKVKNDNIILFGGLEDYEPLCLHHFFSENRKK